MKTEQTKIIIFKKGDIYTSKYGGREVINDNLAGHREGDFLDMKLFKKAEDVKRGFSVGDRIGGFCNGYFGRDDYEDKICVGVFEKYAIFQYDDGTGEVLNFPKDEDGLFWSYVETWKEI